MNDRRWTLALAAIGLVFLYLLGQFGYSYIKITGIVRDLADTRQDKAAYRHHVVLISQELDNPFWRTIGSAAAEEAKKYNMDLEYIGPFRLNPAEQAKLLDKTIASRVDGILIQGVKGEDYTRLINKAIDRRIPLITVDTDSPDSKRLTYVGTDNVSSGAKLGEVVLQSIHGDSGSGTMGAPNANGTPGTSNGPSTSKGANANSANGVVFAPIGSAPAHIGIIIGSYEAQNQQQRLQGFLDVVKPAPGVVVAGVAVSNISRIQAAQSAEQLLREHPDINVMVGTSALDAVGILQAVKTLGMQDRIRIFGFDDLDETKQAIARGEIAATVIQKPAEMGREAVRQLHAYFSGAAVQGNHFTAYEVLNRSNIGEVPAP